MKKILIIMLAMLSFGLHAEKFELSAGDCVLIKENKLKDYLPTEDAERFLSQPFNVTLLSGTKTYTLELQNENKQKRHKLYKVCVTESKN